MPTGNFESGQTVPLLIPDAVWREWKLNGVGAEALTELQAEHGGAVGYEFEWGQIIEEVCDASATYDSGDLLDMPPMAVIWHFNLCDVYTEFLDAGGNLGELSDLAIEVLAEIDSSRHELPQAAREDALPACISFDEGSNISAFAVCVVGQANVAGAREWLSNYFIPAVLPMLIDRLRAENHSALAENAEHTSRQ